MILGILYLVLLIASDALGVVVASLAVLLLFFGWRGRRIALSIVLVGAVGAGVGAGAFWLLMVLLKTQVDPEVSVMWAGAGFGLAGLAAGLIAGGLEAVIAIVKRAPRQAPSRRA